MDKQGKQSSVSRDAEWYRKTIIKLVGEIESKRFLKAVYISISDYLKEIEPD